MALSSELLCIFPLVLPGVGLFTFTGEIQSILVYFMVTIEDSAQWKILHLTIRAESTNMWTLQHQWPTAFKEVGIMKKDEFGFE